jgi:DNA-binding NtrC family response regulator
MMESVLIVDDDTTVLSVVSRMLSGAGYETHTASSAQAAEKLIADHKIDIMLVDIVMPERGGLEFIMKEYRTNPGAKTIIMSGNVNLASDSLKILAEQFGVKSLIQKPFTKEELLDQLAKLN